MGDETEEAEEAIEEAGEEKDYASHIDALDEKVKAQVRIWRIDGVPARQIAKRLKDTYDISLDRDAIWNWLSREKIGKKDVAGSLLKQINVLRVKIDNSLIIEVPSQRLRQYLDTLETYAKVYREIPKEGKKKKGVKDIYDALG